ncbi:TRAP transporter permease [Oricola thermophila]|uniref:TRAP transporter fused permease subunit n=1 Tax=Oricola thermophila TaxID=2742145 RepID=A0A6N1V8G3_9HYPH|nr:TRAP transporter fused permease subunit [Oricola thermophila]QKV17261.1 TRAP transporter fused permease subunit [Oricola thermophila]
MRAETLTQTRLPGLQRRGLGMASLIVAVGISLAHIWMNTVGNVSTLAQNGFHFAGFVLLCVLVSPFAEADWARTRLARIVDIAFGASVAAAALYVINAENAIYDRGVRLVWSDWLAGVLCILGVLEFTRRTTGFIIPVLVVLALSYVTWWGQYVPGVFRFGGLHVETILFRALYGDDAMFGTIARISSTYVFMFILFGAFLLKSGAGDFIVDVSRAVAGRMTGGPGFVAVLSSGLTGTISGSAIANTASTGVITIPLMKRAGFPATFAGGVEAAASTGGQLMPPIMGAGAFVMASFTQIPYTTIVAVSVLPAILYFLTVAFFVRIEAKRSHATALADSDGPALWTVFRNGGPSFIIPVALLIVLLVRGYTPTYAAGYAIIACVVASWLTPNRMGPGRIIEALELGARNMIMTAILLCGVGLIVNVITTAGIGNTFSLMIATWSQGSLLFALVLIALASLVLGMGLPVTAAYIVLGTLSAPALYQLILQSQLAEMLAAGQLPETAKAIFMLAAPDKLAALAAPMPLEEARAMISALPLESLSLLFDQAFQPEVLAVALLSAHMIIFWLSQDSNVTPPVCLAAFTGAAIAGSPPMKTGFAAWKIAKGLYFVPLLFAYTPFLSGDWPQMLEIFFFAAFGLWAVAAAIEGYWENRMNLAERLVALAVGAALMWPAALWINIAALAGFAAVFGWNIAKKRVRTEPA